MNTRLTLIISALLGVSLVSYAEATTQPESRRLRVRDVPSTSTENIPQLRSLVEEADVTDSQCIAIDQPCTPGEQPGCCQDPDADMYLSCQDMGPAGNVCVMNP